MKTYSQRVRSNILPLSIAGTLPEAFEEWSFTEETIDHEEPTASCELCEKEELRYHFEIENVFTHKNLWVGSQCILRFEVSVFEDGERLSAADAQRKLERLVQKMRLEACLKALENLADSEDNDILGNALAYYRKNKYLTPKFAFVVFWRLKTHQIDHSPSFFKISLKKASFREDLRHMKLNRVQMLWPALSSSQRKIAIDMGHIAP